MDRILIVETDDILAELVREWLEDEGFLPVRGTVSDGVYVRSAGAAPAAIVFDLAVPPEGWPGLVASLLAAHPGIPLIATSAQVPFDADGSFGVAARLNVHDVIAKPMRRERLIDAVHALLRGPAPPGAASGRA